MLQKSLISIIIIILSSYSVYSNEAIKIREFKDRFANHQKELIRFAEYYNNIHDFNEFEVSSNMFELAKSAWTYADIFTTLIKIYSLVSIDRDRNAIRPIIQSDVKFYIESLDESIGYINKLITRTHSHEIEVSGTHLQEDLRRFQQYLQSIKLPIKAGN